MQVNILEAKNRLSELVKTAAAGEEVIIANRGKPVAKLVKAEESSISGRDVERSEIDRRLAAYLADIDRIPDRPDAFDPLEWDEWGLPK
ncbi:type II toxin-antitoxin system prevent-host-death family antitoxin [Chelativorans sp. AA-79]|uniref:type II toxin-antitoxin system Phd/YefM family antitoxin n=1 Tax=Chelativorans sp. AA-79 TaxID=3028735 RepID=UPI0023F69E7E|nr:type II toxin-antitoxin system prevent-host-death family antitoxin [Chelativorans sp. AA-79]WEX07796.1 type II toxin-antitoxin system prevent-host-death family antitoxin [Chelativorans sp. AA-79]